MNSVFFKFTGSRRGFHECATLLLGSGKCCAFGYYIRGVFELGGGIVVLHEQGNILRDSPGSLRREKEGSRAAQQDTRDTVGIWRAAAGSHRWGDQI